ncbi:MAG TPA: ATP-binding protein [Sedimentisphaerales bacterium]|nr:ATP-binding protein [Sedimentisphaerales bacterium]
MEIYGADINGINGHLVRFRTVTEKDGRGVHVLGLAGKVVREGIVRAQKAVETLDGDWNIIGSQGYTFTLSPAETPKNSSGLDLPIAIMLLVSSILQKKETVDQRIGDAQLRAEKEPNEDKRRRILDHLSVLMEQKKNIEKYRHRLSQNTNKYLLVGTLDITTGNIEAPQFGMMGMISAVKPGYTLIVPEESELHAALIIKARKNFLAYKAINLEEVWHILLGQVKPRRVRWTKEQVVKKEIISYVPNLNAIEGVSKGKIAMMVALAGGHNILLVGPPGYGKTMLATAAMNLMPPPSQEELFEINKIYSAAGDLGQNELVLERPFQQGSNNITKPALYGGGRPLRPGLVSLAHYGILLLDEINLFPKQVVEELRVPLSNRKISVQRVNYSVEFPCRFILVAAMNPCHCGWHNHYSCPICNRPFITKQAKCPEHPTEGLISRCNCNRIQIHRYKNTLSKPLLDRIDLKILVYDTNASNAFQYATRTIQNRIANARRIQEHRYRGNQYIHCNADVPDKSQFRDMHPKTEMFLKDLYGRMNITPRMKVKICLVAQTIADLNESTRVTQKHINIAVDLMGLNNPYFQDF